MAIPQLRAPSTAPTQEPLRGPSGQGATYEAFGGGIGDALKGVGESVLQANDYFRQQNEAAARTKELRRFSDFQQQVDTQLNDLQTKAPLDTTDYTTQANAVYDKLSSQYLKDTPQPFQSEFQDRVAQLGVGVHSSSLSFQNNLNNSFFTKAVSDEFDTSSVDLGQNPTVANLEVQRAQLQDVIASTNLPAARKVELMHTFEPGLEKIVYKQLWVNQASAEALGTAGAQPLASQLIQSFDGLAPEQADQLATAAEAVGAQQAGAKDWAALPARARGALMSVIADLGGLPDSVVKAIDSGDLQAVATEVAKLGGDRRAAEAERIMAIGPEELGVDANASFNQIPYEDRVAIRTDAINEVNAAVTRQKQAETAQYNASTNELFTGLYDGSKGLEDISAWREQQGARADYNDIANAHQIYDKRNAGIQLAQEGLAKINAGQAFDPTDTEDKKRLNALVGDNGMAALQSQNSDWVKNFLVPVVRGAQDIPTDVAGTLQGMMRSSDQKKSNWALDTMAQLQASSPDAFSQRFQKEQESAVNFWRTRKDYMPLDDLLKTINKGNTPEEAQQETLLRTKAREILANPVGISQGTDEVSRRQWLDNFVQESFGKFGGVFGLGSGAAAFPAEPWAKQSMYTDFNNLFEDEYVKYGTANEAAKAAIQDLQRVWSVSSVSGAPTLMRYAPEKYYPTIAGTHDWMAKQLRDEGVIQPNEGFQLIADAQTEAEVGAQTTPSYLLVRLRDGLPHVIQGMDNHPMRQFFSPTAADKAEELKWNTARKQQFTEQDLQRSLGLVQDNSVNTGMPVPSDAYGIKDYFMGVDDASAPN
jgi:hypothetical protein